MARGGQISVKHPIDAFKSQISQSSLNYELEKETEGRIPDHAVRIDNVCDTGKMLNWWESYASRCFDNRKLIETDVKGHRASYNLLHNNCSTVVLEALYQGTMHHKGYSHYRTDIFDRRFKFACRPKHVREAAYIIQRWPVVPFGDL